MRISIPYHWPCAGRKNYDLLMLLGILLLAALHPARAHPPTDLEIDEQLRKLNKPALKTIVTEDDVIDCVDIYKQPAFDHPLLKNHNIETRPTFHNSIKNDKFNDPAKIFEQPWQKHGSCPEGTIPIKRVRRSDLLRARSAQSYGQNADIGECTIIVALADSVDAGTFTGVSGDISAWRPNVLADECLSSASVTLQLDDKTNDQSLMQSGWMVHPVLFNDSKSRLFIQWRNASDTSGCYNLFCPGFVQTTTHISLGGTLQPLSVYDKEFRYMNTEIFADEKKNWWVSILDIVVGYFPAELLPSFEATRANWGGRICDLKPGRRHTTTQMGNGHLPGGGALISAAILNMAIKNSDQQYVPPPNLQYQHPEPNCYYADGEDKIFPTDIGPTLYFGGPGGECCDGLCQ